ncbi:accessory Sec system protein Asp2 [Levilactobacillus bambusae]|uniref:Accessory Sec system protein Asp2 n=1 Tax=Levilactobacillus bambusae TaxID=2024736 RepID=A0A2V1MYN3_9LACO|nr:accessory Sec system protein Asp2 [Levilactobacillus bambusae]PWF99921.1 accessory Sec system protein Asp2 [Levilactobacillus bambusae]
MAISNPILIQLGGQPLHLADWLPEDQTVVYFSDQEVLSETENEAGLFLGGKLNSQYDQARFLIPADSKVVNQLELVAKFPANSVVIDDRVAVNESDRALLRLQNVRYLSFQVPAELARELNLNFFQGQAGFLFHTRDFQYAAELVTEIEQRGATQLIFHGVSDTKLQWLGSFTSRLFEAQVPAQWELMPECDVSDDQTEIEYHIHLDATQSNHHQTLVIKGDQLHQTTVLPPITENTNVSLSVFGRGTGDITIGPVHLRRSHGQHGFMMIGGENQILDRHLNQELIFYFNAGDRQPPLNVYFSGYRPNEGFEGQFMMSRLEAPYVLINDPRLVGGDFYVGSKELEASIPKYIHERLAELKFDPHDLILSGLSMGSFAALYYAADLKPIAVIVGKPLIHLGTIAANSRIKRPDDFDVSLDMLLSWTGGTTDEDIQRANQIFWRKFKTGDFSRTQFDIVYMKDDDYDQNAFQVLNDYLIQNFPGAPVIHKGLIGRHNDQTNEVVKWFISQYQRVLTQYFNRHFD